MTNIIEFPAVEKTAATLLARLESQAEALEEKYVILEELHGNLHDVEKEAECMESAYDEVMSEYAKKVGSANVPKVLLQYSTNASITLTTDDLQFVLSFDPENVEEPYQTDLFGDDDED
jgi:hypothetical protein